MCAQAHSVRMPLLRRGCGCSNSFFLGPGGVVCACVACVRACVCELFSAPVHFTEGEPPVNEVSDFITKCTWVFNQVSQCAHKPLACCLGTFFVKGMANRLRQVSCLRTKCRDID